jgi:cell division protein ZapD
VFPDLTYEHPLNERIRTFLRLEFLFGKVAYFLNEADSWMARAAVEGILDILAITARADIKTELLKELDRNRGTLNRIRRQPGVDLETLGKILDQLGQAMSDLHALGGQIGQSLRQDEFLKGIAKRSSIPGGTCSFDLPLYYFWLRQPPQVRQQRLHDWMRGLQPVNDAITLVLSLARTSSAPREVTATGGFFQEALNAERERSTFSRNQRPQESLQYSLYGRHPGSTTGPLARRHGFFPHLLRLLSPPPPQS